MRLVQDTFVVCIGASDLGLVPDISAIVVFLSLLSQTEN